MKVVKKIVKVLLKAFGIYMIFDVLCIAYIGEGELIEEYEKSNYKNLMVCNKRVLNRATKKIKDGFRI